MEILHIQKKYHLFKTLEPSHIHNLTLQNHQINDNFTDTNNPMFDIILKAYPT
jgi:hypothetical protein